MSWDRKLWGVQLVGVMRERPILIGQIWHDLHHRGLHKDEPTRALLFVSRSAARAWCKAKMDSYKDRPEYELTRKWRFRAVRVREKVTVL